MDVEVTVPAMNGDPSEIYLVQWLAVVGQEVVAGEPLFLVEADKAQVEVPAVVSGRVAQVVAGQDEALVTGQVVAVIEAS